MLDDEVKMEIREAIRDIPQREHKGWNRPEVKEGTTIFVLKYIGYDGYYTYSYLDRDKAQIVIDNGKIYGTNTVRFMEFNRTKSSNTTIVVN
jgi:hypothetical protein